MRQRHGGKAGRGLPEMLGRRGQAGWCRGEAARGLGEGGCGVWGWGCTPSR